MSLLSTLLTVFSSFTVSIQNGFQYLPITKIRNGAIFTDMQIAVNFVDQAGKYFLGQSYGSSSVLSQPSFEEAQEYKPGDTTPPRTYPTFQRSGYSVPLGINPANMYSASDEAIQHIKTYERLHQRPYFIDGQKYIGYGHKLSKDDKTTYISMDQANTFLQQDVTAAEGMVKGAVSGDLAQGQFDALVDFAFTMSESDFKSSDVAQKMGSGDIAGACTALAQWCYVEQNGVIARNDHLTARRTGNIKWATMAIDPQQIA